MNQHSLYEKVSERIQAGQTVLLGYKKNKESELTILEEKVYKKDWIPYMNVLPESKVGEQIGKQFYLIYPDFTETEVTIVSETDQGIHAAYELGGFLGIEV